MAEPSESLERRLAALSPEARKRVEAALKTTIEAELVGEAAGGVKAGQFSRGIIFSRVTTSREQTILDEAVQMDQEKFKQFAERLAKLKEIKGEMRAL